MTKSAKEAFKHWKKGSRSVWSILWAIVNFAWLCYATLKVKGVEATAEVITSALVIGLVPYLIGLLALYIYHYLRSDLYLEQARPQMGKSLITGTLLKMVEHWKPEPITGLGGGNEAYIAYRALMRYRASYEFDYIHSQIDEFIKAFEVSGNFLVKEIKTSFSTREEAEKAFPKLKELAKQITRGIT